MSSVDHTYTLFTDGGCIPNPGCGGWAVLIINGANIHEFSGFERDTTNNRMELIAAIKGLENLPTDAKALIYTDSEYLRKGITEWLPGWVKRGWKRKGGALANQDLWVTLDLLTRSRSVVWHWVRGHSGNKYNERVDELVQQVIAANCR